MKQSIATRFRLRKSFAVMFCHPVSRGSNMCYAVAGAALTIVRLPLPEFCRPSGEPNSRASPHGEAAKNSHGVE